MLRMPNYANPITAAEASSRHDIPKRTILAAIERGALKARKLPGSRGAYLLDPAEVKKYADRRKSEAASA